MGLFILGLFLALWGVATMLIGLIKPKAIWQIEKIQGFVKLLSDTGTMIFFLVLGAIVLGAGIFLVITNIPL